MPVLAVGADAGEEAQEFPASVLTRVGNAARFERFDTHDTLHGCNDT